MLLDTRLEAEVEIRARGTSFSGSPYFEATLVSEDGQTLHLFDGQLKETGLDALQIGRRYRIRFRPFVNNRWVELKVASMEPLE